MKQVISPSIHDAILSVLDGGDILLIIPPFTTASSAALGPHILQALAKEKGFRTEILYLDILLASILGREAIEKLSNFSLLVPWRFLGERLFARSAYGLPKLGCSPESCYDEGLSVRGTKRARREQNVKDRDLEDFLRIEEICATLIDETVQSICSLQYPMIGASIRMEQTNCSIALFHRIKRLQPDVITLVGGANCDGEMAEGIASLTDKIDYIFSGESEFTFSRFLDRIAHGKCASEKIIRGKPLQDLNSLPLPDYGNFIEQRKRFLGDDAHGASEITYETSRGCWWGEKHECTFCGQDKIFRQKEAGKVLHELSQIHRGYPGIKVFMSDNIMPYSYHKELLPKLQQRRDTPSIFYMQKANIRLEELLRIRQAGITHITTGIESLSSSLLQMMNKGVSVKNNILLLRNTSSLGVYMTWFLLWGLPGEKAQAYQEMLDLLPLLRHFQAPSGFFPIRFERSSSYVKRPQEYHITKMRPWNVYRMIYPEGADIPKLAHYFAGNFPSELHEDPGLIQKIDDEIAHWKACWEQAHLRMTPFDQYYLIYDNRGLQHKSTTHLIEKQQAREIMRSVPYEESENLKWAVEKKLGVVVDSWYVPLVTAAPELLLEFEGKSW